MTSDASNETQDFAIRVTLPATLAGIAASIRDLMGGASDLGIGVAVARRLAIDHRGDLRVSSAGTRRGNPFVLTLPLAAASLAQP